MIFDRCAICDYQKNSLNGQSIFFNSLPDKERNRLRFSYKDEITGDIKVGCDGCLSPIKECRKKMSSNELIKLGLLKQAADALLEESALKHSDKVSE